jgi:hypothetical protein
MMPSIISHDLMRANEEETVRATRYAHHRAHTYRRPGPFLASLLQAWMSKIPTPRHVNTAPTSLTPVARDPLRLAVSALGSDDIGGAPMRRFRQPHRLMTKAAKSGGEYQTRDSADDGIHSN